MSEDQQIVVFCLLLTERKILSTATIGKCCKCGTDIWVAPSTRIIVKENPTAWLICSECAPAHITKAEEDGDDLQWAIAKGAIREAIEEDRRQKAARNN